MNSRLITAIAIAVVLIFGTYYIFRSGPITNYPSKGTDIIAFGDSLVQGVGSTDGNDFVSQLSRKIGKPIINLGHSGDTTEDGVARINEIDKLDPKVVILLLGGNDYLRKMPIVETRQNLTSLIKKIHARGAIVLLVGVRGGLLVDKFDTEFNNLRDTYHTAFVSDVITGFLGDMRYMSDAVHPNDAGYKIIAERIYPVLTKLIK